MKKVIIGIVVLLIIILSVVASGYFYVEKLKKQPPSEDGIKNSLDLSQEDVVNLTKPAVVRVVQHAKGSVTFPKFTVSFFDDNFNISLRIVPDPQGGQTKEVPFDEYSTGSGFIVNKNGYILTNSHVISQQAIKIALAGEYGALVITRGYTNDIYAELAEKAKSLSDEKKREIEEKIRNMGAKEKEDLKEAGEKFAKDLLEYILTNGKFNVEKKVVVLDPNSKKEKVTELFSEGLPVKIVSVNDDFYKDNKDVALIKIDEGNLPAIALGNSETVSTGEKISIFGFPSSAEFNEKNLLEATFTGGSINALKDSDEKDFKIFQSDAKISHGSSGGPFINKSGEAIGVVTYQSSNSQRESGDNFAFAIPANLISEWVNKFSVNASLNPAVLANGDYQKHLTRGLLLADINRCKAALAEFELAKNSNEKFPTKKYASSYVEKCQKTIADGKSIDTRWDEKRKDLEKVSTRTWISIGAGILIVLTLIIVVIFLFGRVRREEEEIDKLEDLVHENDQNAQQHEKISQDN